VTDSATIREWITERATTLGFDAVGFSKVVSPPLTYNHFDDWLINGYHGSMSYLPRGKERRKNPQQILPGACSYISVALNYFIEEPTPEIRTDPARGQIAMYAHGKDYHDVLTPRLEELGRLLDERTGSKSRAYVDTGALLEREIAANSGLGFIGKNSCLIHPKHGSYFLLGELITTADLTDIPVKLPESKCGTCIRCLSECPTSAIVAPYQIDSRRCISYLTIEYRGEISEELRPLMKNWIFGCDDCQTCCPWNRFSESSQSILKADYRRFSPPLLELYSLTQAEFREMYADTPILRPGRDAFLRSVAVALTNWGSGDAVSALNEMCRDTSELVRSHAIWGIERLKKKKLFES